MKCTCRESSPGHKHGRLVCCRYTTGADASFIRQPRQGSHDLAKPLCLLNYHGLLLFLRALSALLLSSACPLLGLPLPFSRRASHSDAKLQAARVFCGRHVCPLSMSKPCHSSQDSLAEWSKALASGASPQGRGFEPHSCHLCPELR